MISKGGKNISEDGAQSWKTFYGFLGIVTEIFTIQNSQQLYKTSTGYYWKQQTNPYLKIRIKY